jgi:hypothetical protein
LQAPKLSVGIRLYIDMFNYLQTWQAAVDIRLYIDVGRRV